MHNPCTIRGEELVEGYKELEIGSQTLKILDNHSNRNEVSYKSDPFSAVSSYLSKT